MLSTSIFQRVVLIGTEMSAAAGSASVASRPASNWFRGDKKVTKNVFMLLLLTFAARAATHAQISFASQSYSLKHPTSLIVAGDFNGDGNVDIAALDQIDGTIDVLLASPGGIFPLP